MFLQRIPPPIFHVVLARRHVINVARHHNIEPPGGIKFQPFSTTPMPIIPPLDFSTPSYKVQCLASKITKRAEMLELRREAVEAGAHDVVARLDECSSFGAGAFLNAIPLGRDRSGAFRLRGDHWMTAARAFVGLPPLAVDPADVCTFCNKPMDDRAGLSGSTRGSVAASLTRASIHPSVCSKGQFKQARHDAACEMLCKWTALGGQGVCDHW